MAICWERTVPLPFHLCCFYFTAVLIVGVPFPFVLYRLLIIAFLSTLQAYQFVVIAMVLNDARESVSSTNSALFSKIMPH